MAPSDVKAHIPSGNRRTKTQKSSWIVGSIIRRNSNIYLFKVTKMSIHCTTNCFQKFKSLFCFNIGKRGNLVGQVSPIKILILLLNATTVDKY